MVLRRRRSMLSGHSCGVSLSVCRCQWAMRGLRNTTESVVQPTPFAAERQSIAASPARHTHTVVCIVCMLCHTTTLCFALWFCSPTHHHPPPTPAISLPSRPLTRHPKRVTSSGYQTTYRCIHSHTYQIPYHKRILFRLKWHCFFFV